MEAKVIEILKTSSPKILEDANAKTEMVQAITDVYLKTGMNRTLTKEAIVQEVAIFSSQLLADIADDPKYKNLHTKEISYCFNNGMKGRLGTDKDIVIKYMTLLRWLEGYVSHPQYRDAIDSIRNKPVPVEMRLEAHEFNEEDVKKSIIKAYNDFVEYKAGEKERKAYLEDLEKHPYKKVVAIGDAFGVPLSCMDFGRLRIEWLIKNGYAHSYEKFIDALERAHRNGGKFEKIV